MLILFHVFVCRHFLCTAQGTFCYFHATSLLISTPRHGRTEALTLATKTTRSRDWLPAAAPSETVCLSTSSELFIHLGSDGCNINTRSQIQQRDCRESGHWTDFLSMVVIEAFYDRALIATQIRRVGFILSRKYLSSLNHQSSNWPQEAAYKAFLKRWFWFIFFINFYIDK